MTAAPAINADLETLQAAAALGGADTEVTLQASRRRTIGWSEGKPSLNNASESRGVCIRVIAGGGQGIATTTVADAGSVAGLAQRALEAARSTGADAHRSLAPRAAQYPAAPPADAAAFRRSADEVVEELRALERSALAFDRRLKKVIRLNFSEARYERGVSNSRGVRATSESTVSSFSIELLADDGKDIEAAWDYEGHRLGSNLALADIVRQTAENAVRSLGGGPIPTGKYPVVFHPRVGSQLLDLIGDALSAEAVQLGRSFLRGLVGKRAAAPVVTIVDDPFLPDGVATAPFDDEGVPHRRLQPVEAGLLSTYFYDLRSAARDGCESNGHGVKESFGAPPRPGPTNLFIRAGKARTEDMLASGPRVFLLREVMGLHMADPITGEFSLGASGLLYEKGQFSRPVRGVTIAGKLADVLHSIEAVGQDLRFYGSAGSPSVLVGGLTIAGQ